MKHEVQLELEKETKGAIRYKEVNLNGVAGGEQYLIGTLYLRKSELEEPFPKLITVTLEAE